MSTERFYPITSLHKDDLRNQFRDPVTGKVPRKIQQKIDALSDDDMHYIAKKLADVFCNCCYWDALQAIFEDIYL